MKKATINRLQMRFCRGFLCFQNSEIWLECALLVPYRPKKCFTRRPDAHIFSGKYAIKKRTCRRPLKCCSQAVSTARNVLCTSCIASQYPATNPLSSNSTATSVERETVEKFKQYLETDLLPHLGSDSVLVMDNMKSHHAKARPSQ